MFNQNTLKSALLGLAFAASTANAQKNYSENRCYQEGNVAYGNTDQGDFKTDLTVLDTLSGEHRLVKLKACTNKNKTIKGIQFTTGVYDEDGELYDVVLSQTYGDTSSRCSEESFGPEENLTDFTIFWNDKAVVGMSGKTSLGANKSLGDITSKGLESYTNSFDGEIFHFVGLFGTSTDSSVQSLGGIRMKTDCSNFGTAEKNPKSEETADGESSSDSKAEETSGGDSGVEEESGSSLIIVLIIVVVALIVAAAIAAVLVIKMKKGNAKTTVAPMNRITQAEAEAMPDREDITPADLEEDKDLTGFNDRNETKGELRPTDHDDVKSAEGFKTNETTRK
jgi:hypothetical protein